MSKNGTSSSSSKSSSQLQMQWQKTVTAPWTRETVRENCPPAGEWGCFCGRLLSRGRPHLRAKNWNLLAKHWAEMQVPPARLLGFSAFSSICLCKIFRRSLVQFACITANMASSQMKPPACPDFQMSVYISGKPSIISTTNTQMQWYTVENDHGLCCQDTLL